MIGPRTAVGIWVAVDVVLCGVVWRIAPDVRLTLLLIDANVINEHSRRKWKVLQIDFGEVEGHAKLHNDVLDAGAG